MFDERVFSYSPQGGFRYFKGHSRTRWCLRCVFCSVMHHCVVRRSGSVPTEITEPTRRLDRPGTYSSKHCKAKTSRQAYWSTAISRSQPSGCILLRSQKSYWKPCHIRNSLGTIYFPVWEVWVNNSRSVLQQFHCTRFPTPAQGVFHLLVPNSTQKEHTSFTPYMNRSRKYSHLLDLSHIII